MHVASSLLAGAAALLIGAGTASAATAVASNDLNVRSGPGTQYPVVTVIPQGGAVTATDCNGSWCRVDYRGRDGWASQAYLSGAVATGAPSYGYAEPEYDTGYPAYAYDYSEPYYGGAYYGAPLTFGLGSGIAGIAGVALSQIDNVSPNLGQSYIIDSFMVVVFGGVGNLWGTLVGAFTLGIANKFLEPVAGAVLGKIAILVLIILFIQKRPRGLFALKGRAVEA